MKKEDFLFKVACHLVLAYVWIVAAPHIGEGVHPEFLKAKEKKLYKYCIGVEHP